MVPLLLNRELLSQNDCLVAQDYAGVFYEIETKGFVFSLALFAPNYQVSMHILHYVMQQNTVTTIWLTGSFFVNS